VVLGYEDHEPWSGLIWIVQYILIFLARSYGQRMVCLLLCAVLLERNESSNNVCDV
jgi:hypothetical protein